MLFNSFEFIFLFLPITFFLYFYLLSKRLVTASKGFLVFSSLFFYSWWNIAYFLKSNSINASLAELKNIIEFCHKNNIKLYMFISPINTKLTDLIYKMGLKETYHYWKKELSQYENIYDFSGYNSITSNISNYFDASHYQTEVASLMFAQIFKDYSVAVPNDFGVLLTPKTIDNILQKEHSVMATDL